MPWVCANCHANNSLSHPTCDVCGSDQRLSYERTTPIETATIAATESTAIKSAPPSDGRITTTSGIIAVIVTGMLCLEASVNLTPNTGISILDAAKTWFIPLILATLMYGRVIAFVNFPWVIYWLAEFSQTPEVEPFHKILFISLVPMMIVFGTWYTVNRDCTGEITTKKLTSSAMVGVTVGIITIYMARGDLEQATIALIANLVMMFIAIRIWWRIMKRIHPNPDLLVLRNLKKS